MAQATPARWVVGVGASCDQLASVEGPVVRVRGWGEAVGAVAMLLVGAHAQRVACEHGSAEGALVLVVVAALPRRAPRLVGLAAVQVASARACEFGAAGGGAGRQGSWHTQRHLLPTSTGLSPVLREPHAHYHRCTVTVR